MGDDDYIRVGASDEIDELRKMAYHSDDLLLQYQQELVQASGITNIKLKFVTNQGYFLELTSKDSELFEKYLASLTPLSADQEEKFGITRRQTLKGSERYSSPYLDNLQIAIMGAREQLKSKQTALLLEAKVRIETQVPLLAHLAEVIAQIDVFSAQALFAQEHHYTRPHLSSSEMIVIQ